MTTNNKYFLTIDDSNSLKGILILLVILGHISNIISKEWHYLLYSFHVASFLIIPFLFQSNTLSLKEVKKIFKRYYIPYLVFFIIAFISYNLFYSNQNLSLIDVVISFFIGNATYLKETIGISALWFFPTLIAMLLLIMINNSLKKYRKFIFLIFIILHFTITSLSVDILSNIPFSIYICLYLFFLGLIIKYIYINNFFGNINPLYIISFFLILLWYIYGTKYDMAYPILPNFFTEPIQFLAHDLVIIFAFFSLILVAKKIHYFQLFGIYSLALYTIHPFVLQFLYLLEKKTFNIPKLLIFFLVVSISFFVVKIIYYFKLNKYIYPR